jgi:PAS domain-containing protein
MGLPLRGFVISRCRCRRAAVRRVGRQNGPVARRGRRFVNRASSMTLHRDVLPVLPVVLPVTQTTNRGITANRRFARIFGDSRGRCIRRNYVDQAVSMVPRRLMPGPFGIKGILTERAVVPDPPIR